MPTKLNQDVASYAGVDQPITWTLTGLDHSDKVPTMAVKGGPDVAAGTSALVGSDTVFTVTIPAAFSSGVALGPHNYQLHVTSLGVVAEGIWRVKPSHLGPTV